MVLKAIETGFPMAITRFRYTAIALCSWLVVACTPDSPATSQPEEDKLYYVGVMQDAPSDPGQIYVWQEDVVSLWLDYLPFYSPRLTVKNELPYISGTQNVNGIFVSELTQDDLHIPLITDMKSTIVNNVGVFNNKVYAVGYTYNNQDLFQGKSVYWVNGVPVYVNLPVLSFDIVVDGNDVYVLGEYYHNSNSDSNSVIVKNGQLLYQLDKALGNFYDLMVVNGDVYVAGEYNDKGTLWKNGAIVDQDASTGIKSRYTHLAMADGNIYTTGYHWAAVDDKKVAFWKNSDLLYTFPDSEMIRVEDLFITKDRAYFVGDKIDQLNGNPIYHPACMRINDIDQNSPSYESVEVPLPAYSYQGGLTGVYVMSK